MSDGPRRGVAVAVLLTVLTGCVRGGTGEPTMTTIGAASSEPATTEATTTVPSPTAIANQPPQPVVTSVGESVLGWPSTMRNPAGVYSLDGKRCAGSFCNFGFMHNGYGSSDLDVTIGVRAQSPITDDGVTAVTVAGHDGIYKRIDTGREEWIADIEGEKAIAISLTAEPGASQADLTEARAIIDSIRTEPRKNDWGFRVVFTLTTNDWDSG